jgi:post-segregation antitoxin (ccd killing protein)
MKISKQRFHHRWRRHHRERQPALDAGTPASLTHDPEKRSLDRRRTERQIPVMKTTVRLDDELLRRAKEKAATLGISLTRLLEDAIRERLETTAQRPRVRRLRLPVSTAAGGLAPGFSTLDAAVRAANLARDRRQAR